MGIDCDWDLFDTRRIACRYTIIDSGCQLNGVLCLCSKYGMTYNAAILGNESVVSI